MLELTAALIVATAAVFWFLHRRTVRKAEKQAEQARRNWTSYRPPSTGHRPTSSPRGYRITHGTTGTTYDPLPYDPGPAISHASDPSPAPSYSGHGGDFGGGGASGSWDSGGGDSGGSSDSGSSGGGSD